jgi:hypothetical protein
MKAEPQDRIQAESGRAGFPIRSVAIALLILIGVAMAWVFLGETEQAVEPVVPIVAPQPIVVPEPVTERRPEPELPAAPDIPEREEPIADPVQPEQELVPVLTLEDSDPMVRNALEAASDASLFEGMLLSDNLVQRSTAMVDGFSRGLVLNKVLPFAAPKPAFKASGQGDHLYMGPDNYVRFDWVAETLVAVETAVLVDVFHQYRGLFESAYAELGYPPEMFDNAVIRALDEVLATPEIRRPIALERKKVFYTYFDPDLEALSDLQKQMLRLGPDNLDKVKDWTRRLREQLLDQAVGSSR